ncbi:Fur family transcriptional regulator [Bombilactobacillus thymidiniphilus]|uniref:Transcriptional repressor n=1 Tax=Bombilactobacillus thymidiniphilus TaxID=2923363 RepID=A0ABY4PBV8_9LACO|nr:transcriptional repressor [Bombilactobacillus thymidiniphilus]UQS83129.1 transcriptional repressor [Bombilactobacillus thymidiniphilus]
MSDLQKALAVLKANNYKLTKQRQALLQYLATNADYYIALAQIDQHLRAMFPKMSHETVYRNVKEMHDIGIVETKHFQNGLRAKFQCDFLSQKHSHFICQNCGRTTEIPLPDFATAQAELGNCIIKTQLVELQGICAQCNQKQPPEGD